MAELVNIVTSALHLLDFSLRIITKTQDVRGRCNGLPELLDKHGDEVKDTKSMLEWVQSEPSLRVPNIRVTVITIQAASQSLHTFFAAQKSVLERGGVQSYLRQLFKGSRDLERLDGIMNGLTRAKMDLGIKIQVVNAGMMGAVSSEVRVNGDAVEELSGRIEALLGQGHGLKFAERDRGRSGVERGVTALGHDDIVAIAASRGSGLASTTGPSQPGSRGKVRVITNNIALQDSLQVNAPIGKDDWSDMDVMAVYGNVADVGSVQFNYPINSSVFLEALRIKYGRE